MPARVTPIDVPAERGRATPRDRPEDGSLLGAQPRMLRDEGVTLRVEDTFVAQHPWLSTQQRSVLRAIARCRTAALGGHLDRCNACGHQAISYNSCRNRHCPKCQAQARERWLQ